MTMGLPVHVYQVNDILKKFRFSSNFKINFSRYY